MEKGCKPAKIGKIILGKNLGNLEKSWKYHGILSVSRSGNPGHCKTALLNWKQFYRTPTKSQTLKNCRCSQYVTQNKLCKLILKWSHFSFGAAQRRDDQLRRRVSLEREKSESLSVGMAFPLSLCERAKCPVGYPSDHLM